MAITSGQRKAALNIFENICLVKQKTIYIFFYKRGTAIFKGSNYYYYERLLFWKIKKHPGTFTTSGQHKAALNIWENICLVKQKLYFFIKEELLFLKEATTTTTMKGYFFFGRYKKKHPGTFTTSGQHKAALNNWKNISV